METLVTCGFPGTSAISLRQRRKALFKSINKCLSFKPKIVCTATMASFTDNLGGPSMPAMVQERLTLNVRFPILSSIYS